MSDLLKRIADYFTNCYQGDDKTAPTMEITVADLRYIANMNVERCRAEAELRNLTYNKRKYDVCEWHCDEYGRWNTECYELADSDPLEYTYCPYCGKNIKVVE